MPHILRALIGDDKYRKTAAVHIKNKDLKNYTTDGTYIYKTITDDEYSKAIINGDNDPFMMTELDIPAEYKY